MPSIKASKTGLTQIRQAIAQKGWKIGSDKWLVEASKILEPDGMWYPEGPYAYGCSSQTWERFLQGTAIRDRSFMAFCQALAINPQEIAELSNRLQQDWGEAPEATTFYGREQELKTLENWIFEERCRLISIAGLAGIGKTRLVRGALDKTALSSQLANRVQADFEYLIWRRLDALLPNALLTKLLTFIPNHQATPLPETTEGLVTQLLQYLRQHRCLLILDNAESILQGGDRAGCYRAGYEGYEELFRRLGETAHQSCVLLMSREKLRDIEEMEGLQPVRSLNLGGLDQAAVQTVFQTIGRAHSSAFYGSVQDWDTLVSVYGGNPSLLESVAGHLLRRFDGSLPGFLEQGLMVFGKIRNLLDWHFTRLSDRQKEIMYQFAIHQKPTSIASLRESMRSPFAQKRVPEILDNLERQIPLAKIGNRFTVQPILIEYVSDRLAALEEAEPPRIPQSLLVSCVSHSDEVLALDP
ncbi:MAG: ATP-binding protein [Leptolyngbya sp. SIO1E4]|nr:ATP-binding protein [Leptolyngbya sp. SIO1E4]